MHRPISCRSSVLTGIALRIIAWSWNIGCSCRSWVGRSQSTRLTRGSRGRYSSPRMGGTILTDLHPYEILNEDGRNVWSTPAGSRLACCFTSQTSASPRLSLLFAALKLTAPLYPLTRDNATSRRSAPAAVSGRSVTRRHEHHHPLPRPRQQHAIRILEIAPILRAVDVDPPIAPEVVATPPAASCACARKSPSHVTHVQSSSRPCTWNSVAQSSRYQLERTSSGRSGTTAPGRRSRGCRSHRA
jgi:hypothetical protein